MKMATFDIETTNLSAAFGRIIVACFKPVHSYGAIKGKVVTFRGDDPKYRREDPIDDSLLVKAIRDEALKYNCLITGMASSSMYPSSTLGCYRRALNHCFRSSIWT